MRRFSGARARCAGPRTAALLGAALAAGLLPWVELLAFVVGGVFLWGALALTMPALVLERRGVGQALRRSWRLAVPDWWRVFGVRALATLIAWVVTAVLVLPASVAAVVSILGGAGDGGGGTGVLGPALLTAAAAVASVVTMPFTAGVLTLLYVDRRMRAEGLDLTLAAAAATGSTRAPSATAPP